VPKQRIGVLSSSEAKHTEDSKLWVAMQAGENWAFSELIKLHYRALYSYGTKLTADKELVQDSIQDVFLDIWRRRDKISLAESPKFYLLQSLKHKIYRHNTVNRLFYNATQIDPEHAFQVEFSIEIELIREEEHQYYAQRLTEMINRLSPRQKEVIYLRFYQNLTYEEIADFMQINRQTVYNLLGSALQRLRANWKGSMTMLWVLLSQATWSS
jgi:RNA polymerase sigma factor (sigma-70 family)